MTTKSELHALWISAERQLAKLQVEVQELRADAARYRWLCDGHGYFMEESGLCGSWDEKEIADPIIDEAMEKE